MTDVNESRPLPELVRGLITDVTGLVRKELDLAKTEASESFTRALGGIEVLAIGLVFAIGALGVLLSALVTGLTAIFVSQGFTEPGANALAALIVAAVVGLIAWALMSKGISALRGSNLKMERTTTSLGKDANVIKEKMS
ncbi:phage holin family protein [Phyllobacterium bourgognense]|uniref:Putative superfamily III holin-X n=1 Tax=Phyllobacterium bourgognense TaxID=314236 RepID=A0A368YIM5_9HYPH|nr:phage holin family protein [Phyllobacterium bourgognense]RCW80080.1 putative superfamily III holin-X [Phyllobacterium bourgognense]